MIDDKGYLIKANLYDGLDCDDDIIFYQNDTRQSKIVAEFTGKKRAAIDVADCTVVCVIQKSDKEIVTAYMENDFNVANRAEYVLSQNALASTGKGIITIFIYGSDNERQTFGSIKFKVLKDVNSGSVESTTEYPVLTKLISDAKVATNGAESAKNEILGISADIANAEKQRNIAETKREESESNRSKEFTGIKKEYESLKSIMIDENNAANLQNQINEANSQLEQKAYKSTISPEEFGAKGDGATDDSQAIQNAINSLSKGGTIVFSPKTYLISNGITINNKGITLKGTRGTNGNGSVLISNNSNSNNMITIGYGQGSMLVGGSIEDISIMGNNQRQSFDNRINKHAIYIKHVSEFNFKNVYISGFIKSGIYAIDWWDSSILSLEIRACGSENTFAGLHLDCDDDSSNSLHFFGLHIEECPFQLKIDKICSNIHIVGSKFERGASAPINDIECLIFIYEGVYNITFDSCFFTSAEDVHHILIKNNYTVFNSCTFSTGNVKGMLAIKHYSANTNYAKGVVINGCVFDRIRGDSESILLNQNDIFANNKVDFISSGNLKGIIIKGKCSVSNNVFSVLPSYTGGVFYTITNKGNIIRNNITPIDEYYTEYVEKKIVTGSTVVSFPSICSELLVNVKVNNNAMTIKIIPSLLESSGSYIQFMGTSLKGKFLVTSNTIKLTNMYDDTSDILSSTSVTVYVKY